MNRLAGGQGTSDTRAAPAQMAKNDSEIGARLDNGETVIKDGKTYKRYKLQVNKNASNPTLKDLANKDSHRVFGDADMPLDDSIPLTDRIDHFFQDLEQDIDKKLDEKQKGRGLFRELQRVCMWKFHYRIVRSLCLSGVKF